MRKGIILVLVFCGFLGFSQETAKESVKKEVLKKVVVAKDTIDTEIIEVITSYTPKVTDVEKIKRKSVIRFTENVAKDKLEYSFSSAPVASTFVPQKVKMKLMKTEKKERLYENYLALGVGNSTTPYLDAYIHQARAFEYEYGFKLKGIFSGDPVADTRLKSTYSNFDVDVFYKKEDGDLDWTLGFKGFRDDTNWYGLPKDITLTKKNSKDFTEKQSYTNLELLGILDFDNSYINQINTNLGIFIDGYSSKEFNYGVNANFVFPIPLEFGKDHNVILDLNTNVLKSKFERSYGKRTPLDFNSLIALANPKYNFIYGSFLFRLGAKVGFSYEYGSVESPIGIFTYPDVQVTMALNEGQTTVYTGVTGGLFQNSYESLSRVNPFIAPNPIVTHTNERYNCFVGFKGTLGDDFNYNIKGAYINKENIPLFMARRSALQPNKDNQSYLDIQGKPLLGYHYGNSFGVIYDNTNIVEGLVELEYELSDNLSFGANLNYSRYTMAKEPKPWNLPKLKTDVFAKYSEPKWYAGTNLYFIGNRDGMLYDYKSVKKYKRSTIQLKPYLDVNINAGYHINNMLTVFVKGDNLANNKYERFSSYRVRGIQGIIGVIWKFDDFL